MVTSAAISTIKKLRDGPGISLEEFPLLRPFSQP